MPFRLRNAFVLASFVIAAAANAWVDSGHMVVAAIAYQHLTPKAKAEADRLLAIGGTDRTNEFLTAACWADDIRRDRRETAPWHYIDLHFRADGKATTNKPDAENAVWAIEKFEVVLKDRSKPDAERADALRFLLHFVGDIHQPLHATARDTDAHPDGDKGGNDFRILPPSNFEGKDRPPHNLHALWDLGVGVFPSTPMGFRPLTPSGRAEIEHIASELQMDCPKNSLPNVGDLNPMDWAQEGKRDAMKFVYNLEENTAPSMDYVNAGKALAMKRVVLAGYRLSELLNMLLG